ncbi:MerR family transcriptional regulator [Myxococcota bacterium]|nr:MerR family transcriptional regulator [Myxococcota bacterium]
MGYRIKTVAELTGISRATLLAWERRYCIVEPSRQDNGYREYSDNDLACLQSVKLLMDKGYKVSEAISLIQEAQKTVQSQTRNSSPGVRIAALHDSLTQQMDVTQSYLGGLTVVSIAPDLDRFLAMPHQEPVDVLVARLSLLGGAPRDNLRRCLEVTRAQSVVVVYEFATHKTLAKLAQLGARLVQGPVRVATLRQAIVEQLAFVRAATGAGEGATVAPQAFVPLPPSGDGPRPPRFTDEDLGRLRETRTGLDCECPNHLAVLVAALISYERYSAECVDRDAEDAALHRHLRDGTGRARQILEELLVRVCEQDGIRI